MSFEAFSDSLLEWTVRAAGLFWLVGAFMLFRQIRTEMLLDDMTGRIERMAREPGAEAGGSGEAAPTPGETEAWIDRDDRARRGWIAGQAVVLAATAVAMLALHSLAAWMVALLVLGQGVYFLWRERTARSAPTPEAAVHARPSQSTVNAGWFSFAIAILVWLAAWRGLLN